MPPLSVSFAPPLIRHWDESYIAHCVLLISTYIIWQSCFAPGAQTLSFMKTYTLFLALLLLLLPPWAFAQSAPLDRTEILGRLTLGYSPSYVAHLVKTRGVDFSPTAEFLSRVKIAGGDGILIERLSSLDLVPATNSSNPDRSFEHLARCAELIHIGDGERTPQECLAAIEENLESAWPIMAAIHAFRAIGIPEQDNVELLRRAVALDPHLVSAHRALASTDLSARERDDELQKISSLEQAEASDDYSSAGAYAGPYPFQGTPEAGTMPPETQKFLQDQIQLWLQKYPDLADVRMRVAFWYGLLGDLDKMRSESQEALLLEPGNPELHLSLANFYLSQHNTEAELNEYREAIRIAPYQHFSRSQLTEALLREKRADEAVREWKDFLTLSPLDIAASDSLIALYLDRHDRKSAIAELRRSLRASSDATPDQAKYFDTRIQDLDRLAHLLFDNGEFDAAALQYASLLRLQPDSSLFHNNLGNVLFAQGRCEDASREYREALRLEPDLPDAHHNLANCLLITQKADDAIAEYQQTLGLDPSRYQSRVMLGAAFLQKGELNAAIEQFQQVLAEQPENADVRMYLGQAYSVNKDFPLAITELQHALSLKPDSPFAENELAWIYATADDPNIRNPSEALRLASHAVQTSPKPVAAILDTLAEALLLNGQHAEARKTEQQATSLDSNNPGMESRLARSQAAYPTSWPSKQ
jgi:tetratricopeptide (TPR) repeat protein